ncbi:hypothetical protein F4781DRAFT_406576 [Annulohypoxylon bovei var. microspora]|nr:hypothetical protein F4781DRAFT_406576 [Annulohypoxylon bovei var. microspora]
MGMKIQVDRVGLGTSPYVSHKRHSCPITRLYTPLTASNPGISRPDAGFDDIFGQTRGDMQDTNAHVLIRVSPAAARSRKQRSVLPAKRRVRIPSNSHAVAGFDFHCEKILTDDDFVPEPENTETENIPNSETGGSQQIESDEDFDIFDKRIESSQQNQGSVEATHSSYMNAKSLSEICYNIASSTISSSMSSKSSLDIFGVV